MNLDRDQFYCARDDRTDRLVDGHAYQNTHCRIVAGARTVRRFSGQVQLIIAANLMARWCRKIEFGFPDTSLSPQLHIKDAVSLHQRILMEVSEADPHGTFEVAPQPSGDAQYTLKIGGDHVSEPVDFTIDGSGWCAWAQRGDGRFGPDAGAGNPVGPAFAACLGVADAFKVAIGSGDHLRIERTRISLFDYSLGDTACSEIGPALPEVVDLGHAQIVGLGSVGSAVAYLLRMLPVAGNLSLIDHDTVEVVNLNRSPLFGISDIGKAKAAVAEGYLEPIIAVTEYPVHYDEFVAEHGRPTKNDIILPLANEFGVHGQIEHNFPPLQIYGTTTPSWGINYHRHIPLQEDCSLCRFPMDIADVSFVCSGARIEAREDERIDAALPFLSVGAAVLILADLVKLQYARYPHTPNFAYLDLGGPLRSLSLYPRQPQSECLCGTRSPSIYRSVLENSRFASFSIGGE